MTGAERAGDVRVLVVDDQTLVRRGLVGLVGLMPGVAVVGEAVDGADGLARVDELAPDVVLLDLRMRGRTGSGCSSDSRDAACPGRRCSC